MTFGKAPRFGGHDPGRVGDAARAGAGVDAVPVARPVEHRRARAHAAHAAHRGGAVRHRVRHRSCRARSSACRSTARRFAIRTGPRTRSAIRRGRTASASRGWCATCGWWIRSRARRCRAFDSGVADRRSINCGCASGTRRRSRSKMRRVAGRSVEAARRAGDALSSVSRCSADPARRAPGTHREASVSLTLGDDNTLISPVTLFEMPEDHKGPPKISILGFTIVRLDPVVIRDTDPRRADHASFSRQRCGSGLSRRGRQEGRSADGDLGIRAGHRGDGDGRRRT